MMLAGVPVHADAVAALADIIRATGVKAHPRLRIRSG